MKELELSATMSCSYNKKGVKCVKTNKNSPKGNNCILPRRQ